MTAESKKMELNRFHWFWVALTLVFFTCLIFFFKVAALAQCTAEDLICLSAP